MAQASRARHSRFTDLERKTSSTSTAGAPTSGQAFAGFSEESGSLIGNITATDVAPDEFTPPTNRPSLRPTDSLSHATPEHAVRKPSASATSTAPFRIHAGRSYKRPTPVVSRGLFLHMRLYLPFIGDTRYAVGGARGAHALCWVPDANHARTSDAVSGGA